MALFKIRRCSTKKHKSPHKSETVGVSKSKSDKLWSKMHQLSVINEKHFKPTTFSEFCELLSSHKRFGYKRFK